MNLKKRRTEIIYRDTDIGIAGVSSYRELIQNTMCEYIIILTNNSTNGFNSTKKITKE